MENIIACALIALLFAGIAAILFVKRSEIKAKEAKLRAKEFKLIACEAELGHAATLDSYFKVYQHIIQYLWEYAIRSPYLRAEPYGVFRSHGNQYIEGERNRNLKSITKKEIFLGDRYGRFTLPLEDWEKDNDPEDIQIIRAQFYSLLSDGLKDIRRMIRNKELYKEAA